MRFGAKVEQQRYCAQKGAVVQQGLGADIPAPWCCWAAASRLQVLLLPDLLLQLQGQVPEQLHSEEWQLL